MYFDFGLAPSLPVTSCRQCCFPASLNLFEGTFPHGLFQTCSQYIMLHSGSTWRIIWKKEGALLDPQLGRWMEVRFPPRAAVRRQRRQAAIQQYHRLWGLEFTVSILGDRLPPKSPNKKVQSLRFRFWDITPTLENQMKKHEK